MSTADGTQDLLGEILREAERYVDHQVAAIREFRLVSEQFIKLAVAATGAGTALFAFAVEPARAAGPVVRGFVLIGILLNGLATLLFISAYSGPVHRAAAQVGPDVAWLADKVNDADRSREDHIVTVTAALAHQSAANAELLAAGARRADVGLSSSSRHSPPTSQEGFIYLPDDWNPRMSRTPAEPRVKRKRVEHVEDVPPALIPIA